MLCCPIKGWFRKHNSGTFVLHVVARDIETRSGDLAKGSYRWKLLEGATGQYLRFITLVEVADTFVPFGCKHGCIKKG
jgi:hypothetical protein